MCCRKPRNSTAQETHVFENTPYGEVHVETKRSEDEGTTANVNPNAIRDYNYIIGT